MVFQTLGRIKTNHRNKFSQHIYLKKTKKNGVERQESFANFM